MKNLFKTIAIAFAVLGLGACNDAYLKEAMEGTPVDTTIADKVNYDGVYAGEYPAEGYFVSKDAVAAAVNTYLKGIYPFCDAGSNANVADIMFGTISVVEGYDRPFAADATYTLVADDYTALGQKYANFNAGQEDANIATFLANNYADSAEGMTLTLTFEVYKTGTVSNTYKKVNGVWEKLNLDLNLFYANHYYTLTAEDYDAMGTASGYPGKYDNFDNKDNVAHFLPKFLAQKYAYEKEGTTVSLTYVWYTSSSKTYTDTESFWVLENGTWVAYDPYTAIETTTVGVKTAQCTYDGSNWVMNRLVGGSKTIALTKVEYEYMYNWVIANKGSEWSDSYGNSEYYSGASFYYGNINNKFSTWRSYYNVENYCDALSDEELQLLAEERLAEVIMASVLPVVVATPDSGLVYNVTYSLYGADGTVSAQMSFMYNDADAVWECLGRPVVL